MKKRFLSSLLLSLLLLPAGRTHAQERGQTGVVMGYPTNIAVIWHVSDRLAIRPEVNITHASSETESSLPGTVSSSATWNVIVGASALWYLARTDNVRTYFSHRLAYGRNSSDSTSNMGDPVKSNTVALSGSFGAQYAPVRRLSVFAEVGYGAARGWSKFQTPISTTESIGWNWSPRTAVGVTFYFGR